MISEGSFKLTVMFFELTNSPATFQAMMNVIVGTDMEEGHDKIVAEVIRRLEENDLYVKPEKCK